MIAVPDYPLGAMENWGLITYRETAMLYDDKISTEDNLARVTSAIAHELSHQVCMVAKSCFTVKKKHWNFLVKCFVFEIKNVQACMRTVTLSACT